MERVSVRWTKLQSSFREKEQTCFQKIVDEFGDAVVGEDGELDRKELAKMVFSSAGKFAMPECNRASGSAEMGAEGY